MTTIEAIYENGVFRPIGPVALADKQRVRLQVDPDDRADVLSRIEKLRESHRQWIARRGPLPDSTPDIAEDRRRDI